MSFCTDVTTAIESLFLQPLLSDPSAPLPPPIIPAVESSRPPVYSPEMTALLGSSLSRNGSIQRTEKQLQHPTILPKRADPTSVDARILGPLSKRREVNLRWRFFESETAKVQPPIEVSRVHVLQASTSLDKLAETGVFEESNAKNANQPTPPPVGFQGTSVLRDLETIASPSSNIQKRAIDPALSDPPYNIACAPISTPTCTVNHFIRRQHRKILANIPILTYSKHLKNPIGKYQVSLSPLAHSGPPTRLTSAVPMADEADLAWLRLPPPTDNLKVHPKSTPSQEPNVEAKSAGETTTEMNQNPRVEQPPKYESSRVDEDDSPKVWAPDLKA